MSRTMLSAAVSMALSKAAMLGNAMRVVLPDVPFSFNGEVTLAPMTYGHRGKGITMAQQKRTSKKARNVARNKKHQKQ